MKNLFIVVFALVATPILKADILNEGWYKVMSANVHVGYIVQRTEFLPATKQYVVKSLLRTNEAGGNITESVSTVSDAGFNPIKYNFTGVAGKSTTVIDASFKGSKMTLVKVKDGKKTTSTTDLKKGTFLSSNLALLLLKKGVKVGLNVDYQAIAEEDGKVYEGKAFIKETKKMGQINLFRILNRFKSSQFVSLMDPKGQIIATKVPELGLTTNLEAKKEIATGSIPVPIKTLKKIFGKIPGGMTQ
ncbi:MAG: hypothetical protein AB8E15_04025 [Bdellovibrionales bacterium]